MEELLKRLSTLMNKEMTDYDITIKDYALRCGISYTLMRRICNGQATDLMLSTVIKICDNSHFEFDEVTSKDMDYKFERIINRCILLYNNAERYSLSVRKFR